ncbi:MAG TPA: retropepsin-like aspartic protease [Pyrinomonadaceae bacterium]|jgi:hypothetical protein|nr:retropepsin-like aspartic protease [Pyrinomonadaceae bacterium]
MIKTQRVLKFPIFLLTVYLTVTGIALGQDASNPPAPNEASEHGPVEMRLNVINHIPVIEAKIDGKGPFRFALDTGFSGAVEVTSTLAEQLDLPVIGSARAGDPSGRNPITVRLFRASSVYIGSAHFHGVTVNESLRRGPIDTDGVIGLKLFERMLVKLDYFHGKFALNSGSLSSDSSLAYDIPHGVPSIEIDVNGIKTHVDIDSGGPAAVTLPLSMAGSLTLTGEPVVVGHGRTADGEFDIYSSTLVGNVRVGDVTLANPRLDFVSIFPNGNLGYGFLRNLIVTFDPANRRVQFEK